VPESNEYANTVQRLSSGVASDVITVTFYLPPDRFPSIHLIQSVIAISALGKTAGALFRCSQTVISLYSFYYRNK